MVRPVYKSINIIVPSRWRAGKLTICFRSVAQFDCHTKQHANFFKKAANYTVLYLYWLVFVSQQWEGSFQQYACWERSNLANLHSSSSNLDSNRLCISNCVCSSSRLNSSWRLIMSEKTQKWDLHQLKPFTRETINGSATFKSIKLWWWKTDTLKNS